MHSAYALSTIFFLISATVSALPSSRLSLAKRQSATTCGSTYYSSSQVSSAASAACNYESSGSEAYGSDYPHQYENYENFTFPVSGPYYEFPILSTGAYSGGSPGPDRVIINGGCQYAGAITHTGASGDDFVGCSGTS